MKPINETRWAVWDEDSNLLCSEDSGRETFLRREDARALADMLECICTCRLIRVRITSEPTRTKRKARR